MMAAHAAPAARKRTVSPSSITSLVLLMLLFVPAVAAADAPPGNRVELGFEERVRSENWDNSTDFNAGVVDARHQLRLRTRAWAKLDLGATTEFMIGLDDESRWLSTPRVALQMDETVFETLYLDHRFADGAGIRAGRQNLTKGDGFLLMDGSPLDGSRTAYLNALDLSWTRGKSRLDLLAISDPWRDRYLPRIHDRRKPLIETDEAAFGLYWSGPACRPQTTLDAYYFYKTETGDTRLPTSVAYQGDRMFHTLGGRLARDCAAGWSLKAELAGQLGEQQPGTDVRAWGGQASVKKTFTTHASQPSLLFGWTGLSGDDPKTAANEGWDPLFSRYPKWSEMYIYTLASEKGAAYWTNLSMFQAEFRVTPLKPLDLRATYYRLDAFHRFPGKSTIYNTGDASSDYLNRGHLFELRADVKLNDSLRGHVLGELLAPGRFYVGRTPGWFFRVEASYSFKHTFAV